MDRFGKSLDKSTGIKAKERQRFLLELEGWDEEADREAWAAFEEMHLKKVASAPAPPPAAAAPIGDPAPAPPAPPVAPDAAGPAALAAAAAPGAPPTPPA